MEWPGQFCRKNERGFSLAPKYYLRAWNRLPVFRATHECREALNDGNIRLRRKAVAFFCRKSYLAR